jgi:hypothetical protein
MRPEKNIENSIKRLRVIPSSEMHKRTLSDVLQAQEKWKKERAAVPGPNIWRTIMKSKISKVAAAAVIIITVISVMYRGNGAFDIATPAFGQMIQAMEEMPWVHFRTVPQKDNAGDFCERWFCYKEKIILTKWRSGKVSCLDYHNNRRTVYEPDTDTVTVSYFPDSPSEVYEVPRSMVDSWM